jgi:HEPN domain-containing protein
MSGPERPFDAWLERAANDLLNIENNLAAAGIPWDTVAFHAHQAAEKSLKALLVARRVLPPKTHDLVLLLGRCAELQPELKRFETLCQSLSLLYFAARYPEVPSPGEEDVLRLVQEARGLHAAIAGFLGQP